GVPSLRHESGHRPGFGVWPEGERLVSIVAGCRKLVALGVVVSSGLGLLVATAAVPAAVAAGGCAGMAYVTVFGAGTVSVISTATGVVSASLTVGRNPIRLAIT